MLENFYASQLFIIEFLDQIIGLVLCVKTHTNLLFKHCPIKGAQETLIFYIFLRNERSCRESPKSEVQKIL